MSSLFADLSFICSSKMTDVFHYSNVWICLTFQRKVYLSLIGLLLKTLNTHSYLFSDSILHEKKEL